MAKYKCPYCDNGFSHTSGEIPNTNEWLMISDVNFEQENETINHTNLYSKMKHIFKCFTCDSLAIFWEGFEKDPIWYKPIIVKNEKFIINYLKLLGAVEVKISELKSNYIIGTIIFKINDPEEYQDFKWSIPSDEFVSDNLIKLVNIIGSNNYLDNDKLNVSNRILKNTFEKHYSVEIDDNEFYNLINILMTVRIEMLDDGVLSDYLFIHN